MAVDREIEGKYIQDWIADLPVGERTRMGMRVRDDLGRLQEWNDWHAGVDSRASEISENITREPLKTT